MLRRVLVPVLAASLATAMSPASPAVAMQVPHRIVVLTVDGTSIEDWAAASAFGSLAATGLLSTRTATETEEPLLLRAAAYTSLGAGAAAEVEIRGPRTEAGRGVLAGALGEALRREGLGAAAIGDASGDDDADAPAERAVMVADGSVTSAPGGPRDATPTWQPDPAAPAGRRSDYRAMRAALERALTWATLVVVDLGDAARADRTYAAAPSSRAPWIARALGDASRFSEDVQAMLEPGDTLIVASLVPPLARVRSGVHLAAVSMSGVRGLPYSGTTRRPGVLTLTDLAPTILARAAVPVPEEMQGRAARVATSERPLSAAANLDADFVRARAARRPLTRIWLVAAAALSTAAFLTIAASRGLGPRGERFPRRLRDVLATGLLAAAAAPAALLVAPVLPGETVTAMGWWALGLTLAAALTARAALGHHRALAALASIDVALVIGDLMAGSPLAARSPLGFQVAGGGRFYGLDEGLLGILLAGMLIAVAGWQDASVRPRRVVMSALIALAFVAVVAAAPALGSKFGATFTLVPAFGLFLVLALGRRPDRASVMGIAIATLLLAGSLAAADALAAPEARSHIGREIAGETPVGPLIGRKLSSFLEITGTTIWLPIAIVIAGPAIVFVVRRRNLLARGFWGLPGRRAALVGSALGSVAAMVSNDTGIIVVAPALVMGAAAFYGPLLAPEMGRRTGE